MALFLLFPSPWSASPASLVLRRFNKRSRPTIYQHSCVDILTKKISKHTSEKKKKKEKCHSLFFQHDLHPVIFALSLTNELDHSLCTLHCIHGDKKKIHSIKPTSLCFTVLYFNKSPAASARSCHLKF